MVGGGGGGEVRDISVEMTVRGRIFELDFYFSAAIQNISTSQPANEVTKQTNQHSPWETTRFSVSQEIHRIL